MPDFDPQFLAALIVTVGACVWLYNQTMVAFGKSKKPQPFVVEAARRFATREDHDALARKVDRYQEATERRFDVMHASSSEGREKIYNRINTIGEEVASQRKADELTQATLQRIDIKLDKLNERKADKS